MAYFIPFASGRGGGNVADILVANQYFPFWDVVMDENKQTGRFLWYLTKGDGVEGIVLKDIETMQAVAASETAMQAVAASETAMQAVIASETAMQAVAASETAMQAVAASETAMQAVAASETAMQAVIASETAMQAVAASETAMQAVAASETAMQAVIATITSERQAALWGNNAFSYAVWGSDYNDSQGSVIRKIGNAYGAYRVEITGNTDGSGYVQFPVDLTSVGSLKISASHDGSSSQPARLRVSVNGVSLGTKDLTANYQEFSYDVSEYTGMAVIKIDNHTDVSAPGYRKLYVSHFYITQEA